MRVAVVGGGIAGLAAGYRLQRSGAAPVIFEKGEGDRTGSQRVGGFIIDKGAYTIPETHSAFLSLIRELGLSDQLRETPGTSSTFVNGEEHRIKIGSPADFLRYKLLSFGNKTDLVRLYLHARTLGAHLNLHRPTPKTLELERETARDFLLRDYSEEILEKIAYPIFADLFLGVPEENSRAAFLATLPNLARFRIYTLACGMGMVTGKLRDRLEVKDHTPVLGVRKTGAASYRVETGGKYAGSWDVDKVVFAVPPPLVPGLVEGLPEPLARTLDEVRYSPSMVVALGQRRPFVEHSFINTFLRSQVPAIATVIQDQHKGEGRIPEGKGLAAAVLTRDASARWMDRPDAGAVEAVLRDMDSVWSGLSSEVTFSRVYRWPFGGVQLPPGTLARQLRMREQLDALDPNWAFAGDGLYRASMEVSVRTGLRAAERVLAGAETPEASAPAASPHPRRW
ncbi:MAG: FAD-dependent oxidoreductase [Deltaproteobacteria bacterium]|nr:FAD-dependent oxidoreductase [Deltaproteobacteria bacterium]